MNRIEATFRNLRKTGRKGLVGYLTAGFPDVARSERDILQAVSAGLDVLELGVPFSDPTADGPVIQASSMKALAGGMTVAGVFALVRRVRAHSRVPIVLFGYANPFLRYGYARLCTDAAKAGVDGLLVVDLPFEESGELRPHADRNGLCLIPLVAPTTPPERARELLRKARGFVYYIMVRGVTGARSGVAADLDSQVAALKRITDLPVAAGFGVSSGLQARAVAATADAVVVGSALVDAAGKGSVRAFVTGLREAMDASPAKPATRRAVRRR